MFKSYFFFPIIISVLALIAGCGGGKDPNEEPRPEIEKFLSNFETAVEAYNVNGMLNCLSDDSFTLRISEAGLDYDKNKTKLAGELAGDKENQEAWRKLPGEDPKGHGYKLDLEYSTTTYSNETSTGAIVNQTFKVYESAVNPGILRSLTDNGVIIWQLVKTSGEWKAVEMTIEYQPLSGASLFTAATSGGESSKLGFMFGDKYKDF